MKIHLFMEIHFIRTFEVQSQLECRFILDRRDCFHSKFLRVRVKSAFVAEITCCVLHSY